VIPIICRNSDTLLETGTGEEIGVLEIQRRVKPG
jgi:hypothetical protein